MNSIDKFHNEHKSNVTEGYSQQSKDETAFLEKIVNDKNIKTVMEIGFNGGHSADVFLRTNPDMHLTSFDLGAHKYVKVGKAYIDKTYPGRHKLILGDSRKTIPQFLCDNKDKTFDLIFIDGGHDGDVPEKDIGNCSHLAHKDTIVIMDDINRKNVQRWNIKPNKAWDMFRNSGQVTEIESIVFSATHGVAYGKYNKDVCGSAAIKANTIIECDIKPDTIIECDIYICSLMRSDRVPTVEANHALFPNAKVFPSIDGYDVEKTIQALKSIDVKFVNLNQRFKTYGTLANWITKYNVLQHQVDNKIPFMCFVEDDIKMLPSFEEFVNQATKHLTKDVNMVRLGLWGEAYITSFDSAKRILSHLTEKGVILNIDNQLKGHCGKEIKLNGAPIQLTSPTNKGDCLKTKAIVGTL
jgi:predicted O-methyltransferase YrrM